MNPFVNKHIAETYDDFYKTENGKIIDLLEKKAISNLLHNIKQNTMLPTLTVFICKIMIINLMPFWLGTTLLRKLKEKFSGYLEGNI